MKAVRILRPKESLQIQEIETPKPRGSQVLVKVHSSGVCHSDVHLWEGGYEGPHGLFLKTTDRGVKYPLTPGHEIAGTVDSLGDQAEGFSENEKVLVYPWIGEGLCPACRVGEENLCDKPRSLGVYTDGGYAEYVLGADAVIDLVNTSKTLEADMRFLGRRARLALVGLFGGEMKLNLISMPTRAYKIIGIDNGSIIDLAYG
jgi:D-arabinose 1-dehydrogenase-like Zn-dependent alcohol dehydrogenase